MYSQYLMEPLFKNIEIERSLEDLSIVIKYDGTSFSGVMDIRDLGNELLGIEYCLRSVIRKLKDGYLKNEDKDIKAIFETFDINSLEIVTEGFVNNCFLKRIKFKEFFDEIENRPELMKFVTAIVTRSIAVYGAIYVAQITANSEVLKSAFQRNTIPSEVVSSIQESNLDAISRQVALEALQSKKYREESMKTIVPLRADDDSLVIKSDEFETPEKSITIDNNNKDVFLVAGNEENETLPESERFDTVAGRISSIKLDATKNQIGFKVANEGAEIDCHLGEHLNIQDYQNGYLGEWVELSGNIHYNYDKATFIKIDKITKIPSPEISGQIEI